ncbi:hypothetical protein CK203_002161 [Vitis vinifera]|uniref:Gamma-tubulin complex component n=1 Tax=Vitis vinifera TaxID=29760 RepID=A0A438KJM8_VITVI|nr:hypothetical protein CK203_002161 [Vitis vinifera]
MKYNFMPVVFFLNNARYKYVSKLTIKLLEEGFDLQEHFLALRRYHFMELADWADLFIMSLWNHRWNVTEADQRLSEIQGLLELSLQRSSCERDLKKDKLFVYMKGHAMAPLSTFSTGVHSFSFLGLGYRVDWPISIILTPGALKIYADIFSFLIQVKLAAFSLTDVWCSLKLLWRSKAPSKVKALAWLVVHGKAHTLCCVLWLSSFCSFYYAILGILELHGCYLA